jgi:hypothetical protein
MGAAEHGETMIKSLKIGPVTYRVELVRKLNAVNSEHTAMEWLNGQVLWQESLINIEEGLNEDVRRAALLHESIHAILEQAGITEHPEPAVIALGYGLLSLLRENPDLVIYVTKGETDATE